MDSCYLALQLRAACQGQRSPQVRYVRHQSTGLLQQEAAADKRQEGPELTLLGRISLDSPGQKSGKLHILWSPSLEKRADRIEQK